MKPIYIHFAGALTLTFAIAACVPAPRPTPPVQTRPTPAPTPAASPVQAPVYDSWMDAPQTPGDWSYAASSGGGTAAFGTSGGAPLFSMRCELASRTVFLRRAGPVSGATQMTVRSETQTRTLPARIAGTAVEASLTANDRLLDAMALSKGRFAVEAPGAAVLYLPSWAEVTRVIEDCR